MSRASVVRDLASDEPATRLAAIALVRARATASPEEIVQLVECLGHARKAVQRQAAETLGVLHRAGLAVRPAITAALTAPALGHRWGAVFACAQVGGVPPDSLPILLEVLGSDDGDRRWAAAELLRGMADDPRLQTTLRAALGDANPVLRKMTWYCLRDLGASWSPGDALLVTGIDDADAVVRLAALAAAPTAAQDRARIAAACVVRLQDEDMGVARAATAALARLGLDHPGVRAALTAAMGSPDAALAKAARRALEGCGR